jgi:hypothetical protein
MCVLSARVMHQYLGSIKKRNIHGLDTMGERTINSLREEKMSHQHPMRFEPRCARAQTSDLVIGLSPSSELGSITLLASFLNCWREAYHRIFD